MYVLATKQQLLSGTIPKNIHVLMYFNIITILWAWREREREREYENIITPGIIMNIQLYLNKF